MGPTAIRRSFLVALCLALSACSKSPVPADLHPLAAENKLRALEIPLAKKNETYTVFDLRHRGIQIKIRGVTLREFRVLDQKIHRPWNSLASAQTLVNKGISRKPERTVINPPKTPGAADTMVERLEDSFELEDMPEFYTLEFEDKDRILVLPRSSHPLGFLQRLSATGVRAVFFFNRLSSPRSPAATIVLSPNDARALYWSFALNQKAIICAP